MTEQERQQIVAQALRSFAAKLPQQWQEEMARTVPTNLVRSLVNDFRGGPSAPSSLALRPGSAEDKPRAPSGGTAPLQPPPGIAQIDAIAESFARADRAAAARVRVETELVEAAMNDKIQVKAKTEYDPFSRERMGFDENG